MGLCLLPEINDNPNRDRAAPAYNPAVEKEINETLVMYRFRIKESITERNQRSREETNGE